MIQQTPILPVHLLSSPNSLRNQRPLNQRLQPLIDDPVRGRTLIRDHFSQSPELPVESSSRDFDLDRLKGADEPPVRSRACCSHGTERGASWDGEGRIEGLQLGRAKEKFTYV